MSDKRTEAILATWLKATALDATDIAQSSRAVDARLDDVKQRRWWLPGLSERGGQPPLWGPSRGRVGVAATAAILVATVLVLGLLTLPSVGPRGSLTPGGTSPEGPAIHWSSGVVDLRADSVTLRIGEEAFTTEGEDVVVSSYGTEGDFILAPAWVEGGQTFWLRLGFTSDDVFWAVREPSLWMDGVYRPDDPIVAAAGGPSPSDPITYWPRMYAEYVDFDPSGWIRMPLGEAYLGDWRLESTIEVPVCGSEALRTVDVSLTFEDVTLTVTPRSPSFFDQIHDDYFTRGSLLGDLMDGPPPVPQPRPLDCADG